MWQFVNLAMNFRLDLDLFVNAGFRTCLFRLTAIAS
jgi:hypothetical protein